MNGRSPHDRGTVALTALVGALVVGALAVLLVATATAVEVTAARARTAADAAALAGAAASPLLGGDGRHCAAAARAAAANGAGLRACDRTVEGAGVAVVDVTVAIPVHGPLAATALDVQARAAAGLRPAGR